MAEIDIEGKSKAFLVNIVKNFKIFIDTCSLLSEYAESFWEHILPVLKEHNSNVVVPLRVYQEVAKYADDPELCKTKAPDDAELNARAKKAKLKIINFQSAGLVRVLGDDRTDNFADNVFQTVFTQFRMKYNLILITQDKRLSEDIMKISESKSVLVKNQILVRRINKYGYLSFPDFLRPEGDSPRKNYTLKKPLRRDEIPEAEKFALADAMTVPSTVISVSHYPAVGDTLTAEFSDKTVSVELKSEIGSGGGEGYIYDTDHPNTVAKIYKPGKIDGAKFEKLKLMLTKNIQCEGVCFPKALLYNSRGEFVGFLMDKASGKELQKCIFIPMLLRKYFPNWKKKDTVQLCITILNKLKYLHDRNVILGDINPNNILVVSSTEVYFVDTDSYQIGGYPCPVGTINYTAPEIQKKRFDSFLRTMGNERFAVATLLFMIMLPGKPPYSLQGGEDQVDNIINGDFAYASGERTNGKAPEGVWRYIWSHMPRFLKDDFYDTFHKDGRYHSENSRFSDEDWLKKFEHYAELLADENGKFLANDKMSAELFPTRTKADVNSVFVTCLLCGIERDEGRTEQGYCKDCLSKSETYNCSKCGAQIEYTNYQKYIRKAPKFEYCKNCSDKLNVVVRKYPCKNPRCRNDVLITQLIMEKRRYLPLVCKDCINVICEYLTCYRCGRSFPITYGEKDRCSVPGRFLPTECPKCR